MEVLNLMINPLFKWFSKNPLIVGFLEGIISTLLVQKLLRKQIFHIFVFIYRLIDLSKKRNELNPVSGQIKQELDELKTKVSELTQQG